MKLRYSKILIRKKEKNYNKIELLEESKEIKIKEEMLDNKEFKDNLTDKIATELYLQNFIIMESDILLIVVGELIYSEQLLINKIKEESKKQNKGKIFIIHNLQDFRTKEQVENYITESLLKCSTFNLIKRTKIHSEEDQTEEKRNNVKKEEIIKINENQKNININEDIKIDLNKSTFF